MSIFSAPLLDDYETIGKAAAVMGQLAAYAVALATVAYWVVLMVRPKHKNQQQQSPTKKQMVPIALATIVFMAATVILARLQRRGVDSSATFAAIVGMMATLFVALSVSVVARDLHGDEDSHDDSDADDGDDSEGEDSDSDGAK